MSAVIATGKFAESSVTKYRRPTNKNLVLLHENREGNGCNYK